MRKRNRNMTGRKVEILAPAGSYAAFRAAISAGADAVYAGGPRFGARAYADNFTEEELVQAIQEAHLFGRKFYLTVNTLLKDIEIEELYEYLAPLYACGLDAVIVQDVGVLEYVRTCFPGMDIHASTQMTVTGVPGAKFLEEQGASRVVPARELSLEEIRKIHRETNLEIECFVHGALCYCYSGQCLLSSMIGGRSGNRGQCAQPCRLPYTVDGDKRYYLSPKDICTLEIIPDMVEAGIDSFKIEGRMKKPEYVAGVTAMYRKYTDMYLSRGREGFAVEPKDRENLMDLYNRGGSSEGYYKRHNGPEMMALDRPNHAGVPAARVLSQKGREIHAAAVADLNPGDVLEITGGKGNYTTGNAVKKEERFSFLVQKGVRITPGTILNRTRNESLLRSIKETFLDRTPVREIEGRLTLCISQPAVLTVWCKGEQGEEVCFTAESEECVQRAQNRPLEEERICSQIEKTGNSEFVFKKLDIWVDEGIFVPVSQLNSLRRAALAGLREAITAQYERTPKEAFAGLSAHVKSKQQRWKPEFSVLVETDEQLRAVCEQAVRKPEVFRRVYVDMELAGRDDGKKKRIQLCIDAADAGTEIFLAMPYIFRRTGETARTAFSEIVQSFPADGVLIRNYEEYTFLKECGFDKTVILDHNLYVFNRYAKKFWEKLGVSNFTAPFELNAWELAKLGLSRGELTVYGYFPVMLSAQCIAKSSGRCTKEPAVSMLTDRYGNTFPVKRQCSFCVNILYNTRPLYLGMHKEEIKNLSPDMLRLQFSFETEEITRQILTQMEEVFCGESGQTDVKFEYTQGHFIRGVL